jgi:hypothetical protein
MTTEQPAIRDYIQRTIGTMEEGLHLSTDVAARKQFARMIGDQYEVLIALSASELRELAAVEAE